MIIITNEKIKTCPECFSKINENLLRNRGYVRCIKCKNEIYLLDNDDIKEIIDYIYDLLEKEGIAEIKIPAC